MNEIEQTSRNSWLSVVVLALPYILAAGLLILLIYCHLHGEPINITDEDGWSEWGGCVAFGVLGIVSLAAVFMGRCAGKAQKILLLVLAICAFVAIGEELSWGQRYFGFSPPDAMKSKDGDGVTFGHNDVTAHNISFELGPLKFSLGGMLFGVPMVLVLAFWGIYLPWRVKKGGEKTKLFVKKMGLFLPPIHLGVVLAAFSFFLYITKKSWVDTTNSRELMEMFVPAVLIVFILNSFFRDTRRSSKLMISLALLLLSAGFVGSYFLAIASK